MPDVRFVIQHKMYGKAIQKKTSLYGKNYVTPSTNVIGANYCNKTYMAQHNVYFIFKIKIKVILGVVHPQRALYSFDVCKSARLFSTRNCFVTISPISRGKRPTRRYLHHLLSEIHYLIENQRSFN